MRGRERSVVAANLGMCWIQARQRFGQAIRETIVIIWIPQNGMLCLEVQMKTNPYCTDRDLEVGTGNHHS